jgi:hypothetical protein
MPIFTISLSYAHHWTQETHEVARCAIAQRLRLESRIDSTTISRSIGHDSDDLTLQIGWDASQTLCDHHSALGVSDQGEFLIRAFLALRCNAGFEVVGSGTRKARDQTRWVLDWVSSDIDARHVSLDACNKRVTNNHTEIARLGRSSCCKIIRADSFTPSITKTYQRLSQALRNLLELAQVGPQNPCRRGTWHLLDRTSVMDPGLTSSRHSFGIYLYQQLEVMYYLLSVAKLVFGRTHRWQPLLRKVVRPS